MWYWIKAPQTNLDSQPKSEPALELLSRALSSVGVIVPFQQSQHREQSWRRADRKKKHYVTLNENLGCRISELMFYFWPFGIVYTNAKYRKHLKTDCYWSGFQMVRASKYSSSIILASKYLFSIQMIVKLAYHSGIQNMTWIFILFHITGKVTLQLANWMPNQSHYIRWKFHHGLAFTKKSNIDNIKGRTEI